MASDARAICADCGHVQSWHDRDAARAMRSGELASDRRCYREVGGAACRCSGFRDSGEIAIVAGRPRQGLGFQAITEINNGQVRKVTIVAGRATLELQDGDKQQMNVPDRPETFQKVLDDYNAANPSRPIVIDYQQESQGFQVIASIFLSLLPILLLGAFFLYLFRRSVRR
jgi:hypothetical protein